MYQQARITYNLSEAGRKASLREGGDGRRRQFMIGGITNADDLEPFSVDDHGLVLFDATLCTGNLPKSEKRHTENVLKSKGGYRSEVMWDVVPTWEDLMEYVRWAYRDDRTFDEVMEQVWKEEQARLAAFTANPSARAETITEAYVTIDGSTFSKQDHREVFAEASARAARDQEQIRVANRATLSRWIKQHGTENQKQRLQAGLLPWYEANAAVEEFLFNGLSQFPRYRRFVTEEVCECVIDTPGATCDVKFKSVDATELTAEEWDQFSKIKAVAPDATFLLREHYAYCRTAETQRKRGVIVKFTMDLLTFKREYALSMEPEKYLLVPVE